MRSLIAIKLIFAIIFMFTLTVNGQKNCDKYVIKNCEAFGTPFKYSGQSKSALFEVGQKSILSITAFAGFEYRISLCAEKNMKGIFFRIRENDTNRTLLYDSSIEEEDFLEKMFYVKKTKDLLIEVVVPEGDLALDEQDYKKRFGCVGVLIEYDKRSDLGF
ncbi:MAG: hypothetical protein PF517_03970 [Salinivirgaceae bacterium]|jgi:hypothetical protein|nr:hypothetical protein [Salinivirgaceae bacterium]